MNLRRSEIDLTQGSVWKQIARFAWPLLIGNIFQQMYNTVDSIVLGQYVNKEALAAVGSVGSSINAIIGFFIGIATGAGVVIAQYCGAKDDRKLSDAVQTTMVVALAACVICTFLGNLSVPLFLKIMKMEKTPEVYKMADRYLRIYFWGVSGMLLYNVGAGILRAVGDSLRPLIFLIITTVINTVLDILFVTKYNWKIEGVAYATVIAQFISAFMVLYVLTSSHMAYRVDWLRLRVDRSILAAIFKIGLPSAVQSFITSFSNVFVQGYINVFGADCMAGWTAYGKIDQFALLPISSISLASTTFTGQNLGAGKRERAKEGLKVTMRMAAIVCVGLCIPMILFRRSLISIFNTEEDVLYYGSIFLMMMSPFYIMCAINNIYAGVLRGAGCSLPPMIIMLSSFVAFRQIYLYVFSHLTHSFYVVALAYPMGWILCSTLLLIYYYRGGWEKKSTILTQMKKEA